MSSFDPLDSSAPPAVDSSKVRAPIDPDVLVLDNGSGFIKVGWSGEDAPRLIVPAVLIDNHSQALPASNYDDHSAHNEFTIGYQALHLLQSNFSTSSNAALAAAVSRIFRLTFLHAALLHPLFNF